MEELKVVYDKCIRKTRRNIDKIGLKLVEYRAVEDGNYFDVAMENTTDFFDIGNWMSSFFTGMAILAFETEKDPIYLRWLNQFKGIYKKKVYEYPLNTMHDLGFLYNLYSVALYKLTGDPEHKSTGIKAADELAKRFNIKGGYIRAWGRMNEDWGRGWGIIDCMMNLPLLFWASEVTENSFYKDIAMVHADTTMKYFIRDDCSVYHAYSFNPDTGEPAGGANYCGFDVESHWARGTAWAIYGFAVAYSYSKKKEYLETARKISHKFIENLDESLIPVWDFRLPEDKPKNKDTSAAAIAVCGFIEILKHCEDTLLQEYHEKILQALLDDRYIDTNEECSGILKQSNGNFVYTPFGDYFFIEALAKKLYTVESYW